MKFVAPLLLVLLTTGCSPRLDDGAVLWRGFNHKWDYNHRMGRMGDRLVDRSCGQGEDRCGAFSLHAAAVAEEDRMDYTTYYSRVLASGVAFASVDVEHVLGARNSGLVERPNENASLSAADFPNLTDRENYAVVLSGFDLTSQGPDDKLMFLSIEAGTARWNAQAERVDITYDLALSMHCSTDDCEDNFFEYLLEVSLTVVAWDGQDVEYSEDSLQKVDTWDAPPYCVNDRGEIDAPDCVRLGDGENPDAVAPELERLTRTIDGTGGTTNAFIGLRSFLVDLGEREAPDADRAHHMAAFRIAIHPGDHDPTTGDFDYSLDMFFNNWHDGMQEGPPASRFSYPTPGAATWRAETALFQLFVYSQIDHGQLNGDISWTEGGDYTGPDAEVWASLEFNQDSL